MFLTSFVKQTLNLLVEIMNIAQPEFFPQIVSRFDLIISKTYPNNSVFSNVVKFIFKSHKGTLGLHSGRLKTCTVKNLVKIIQPGKSKNN